jgi:DNA-binding IclR family transcriptional regulator
VYRIVNTLEKHGYLHRDLETKRYLLSRKLVSMGYSGTEEKSLIENSLDVMRELRDAVKETVLISVISEDEGVILEQAPGLYSFRFVVEPGTRLTIHASSHGKAILAYLPESEREAILGRLILEKYTERTITTVEGMREELATIRKRGYAFDLAEQADGVHCASAPILNQHGVAVAALTTTGPAFRLTESSLDAVGQCVKLHADRISGRLGYGLL